MAYEPANPDYTQDRMSYSADHAHFEPKKSRSRDSFSVKSDGGMADHTQYLRPQQPINEAVTSAFDKADTSNNYASPELIAQITAQITQNVIQQLKTTGIQDSGTPVPQNPRQFPSPPIQQPVPLSPSTMSGSSPPMHSRGVYTPPSPQKHHEFHSQGSPHSQSAPFANPPQSPVRDRAPHSYPDPRSSSPLSHSSEESRIRPKGPERLSTGKEETTLEKIWGQLFDEGGHPTVRLGQFLRGLAVHIIEDYEPRHSIVITPTKMAKYYEDVRLPNELYPWSTVFDDERCRISRMLRELSCQHHLVQESYDVRPEIPGLTPVGFERWSTLLIQAHPDEEFERLAKAALAMPIDNPDKKERFPKELSRRLFPSGPDHEIRQDLENAISEHANIDLPRRTSHDEPRPNPSVNEPVPSYPTHKPSVGVIPPTPNNIERERKPYGGAHLDSAIDDTNPIPAPPHHRPSIAESTYTPNNIERERKPYSSIPSESAIDDTNPFPPPPPASTGPIERERKPYSSQPVNGRNQDDLPPFGGPPKPRTESNASTLGRSESVAARPGRADSTARPRPIPPSNVPRGPMEMPKPEIHHHRQPNNAQRRRSPSFTRVRDDFRRSDGDVRGYQPTFQPGSIPSQDGLDDEGRRLARERARRQADEDARLYGESPGARARFERPVVDMNGAPRGSYLPEEDYYRNGGRVPGNGYDYQQPYGGPAYR